MKGYKRKIVFLVGLTGVGKSSALATLERARRDLVLLPNRRELTDRLIIPEVQREAGEPVVAVTDRVKRFKLTARYRQRYPAGMVHALVRYLEESPPAAQTLVFDNLRGLDEVRSAIEAFANARFIVLDAPPMVRLARLIGRRDAFDRLADDLLEPGNVAEQLRAIAGLERVFDVEALLRLAADAALPADDLVKAVKIVVAESNHYDSHAALGYLRKTLDARRLLALDTSALSADEVQARIAAWL